MKKVLFTSILSLSLILVLIPFSTSSISAASYAAGTSANYHVLVSAPVNGTGSYIISWNPILEFNDGAVDYVTIRINWNSTPATNTQVRLYLAGTNSISIPISLSTQQDISNISVTTNTTYYTDTLSLIYEDIDDINTYQKYIYNQLYALNNEGMMFRNYDLTLTNMPIVAYFMHNGSEIQGENNFLGSDNMFFDYPVLMGYENLPVSNTTNFIQCFDDEDCIMILLQNNNYNYFAGEGVTFNKSSANFSTPYKKSSGVVRVSSSATYSYMIVSTLKDGNNIDYARFNINFNNDSLSRINANQFIPLYYGPINQCPDEILAQLKLGLSSNEQADSTSNNINQADSNLNTEIDNINEIETSLSNDFEENIEAIDTTLDITDLGTKFTTSANFVRTQFNNLTTGNPFGTLLLFTLTVGIALLLIGRTL